MPWYRTVTALLLMLACAFQGPTPASAGITGSTAAVPRAVTAEDAGHNGTPAVALPLPDDSSDGQPERSHGAAGGGVRRRDVAECMHGMRWLQTLHEDEVAERWHCHSWMN